MTDREIDYVCARSNWKAALETDPKSELYARRIDQWVKYVEKIARLERPDLWCVL